MADINPTGGLYGGAQVNGSSPSALINAGFAYGGQAGAQQVNNQLTTLLNGLQGSGGPPATVTAPAPVPQAVDPNAALGISAAGLSAQNQALQIAVSSANQKAQQAYWEALASGADADRAEKAAEFAATNELAKQAQAMAQQNQTFNQGLQTQQQGLAAQNQAYTQGMGVLNLAASLQGPANAFTQQAVLHGLNSSGLSNAVSALSGTVLPTFQAPQARPQAASLGSLIGQVVPGAQVASGIGNAYGGVPSIGGIMSGQGSWTGQPASSSGTGSTATAGTDAATQATYRQLMGLAPNYSPSTVFTADDVRASGGYQNAASTGFATFGGKDPLTGQAPTLAGDPSQQALYRQLMGVAPNYMPTTVFTPADVQASGGYQNAKANGFATFGGSDPLLSGSSQTMTTGMGMNENTGSLINGTGLVNRTIDATQGANGTYSVPSGGGATTADYVNGLPAPNKINSTNWMQLDPDTQQFLLGAYRQAGYSDNDVQNSIKQTLPKFTAPMAGSIAA